MNVPARKPALTKAPVREHPVAPVESTVKTVKVVRAPESVAPQGAPRGMGTMTLRIDLDLRHALKLIALQRDEKLQDVVDEALRRYVETEKVV